MRKGMCDTLMNVIISIVKPINFTNDQTSLFSAIYLSNVLHLAL